MILSTEVNITHTHTHTEAAARAALAHTHTHTHTSAQATSVYRRASLVVGLVEKRRRKKTTNQYDDMPQNRGEFSVWTPKPE